MHIIVQLNSSGLCATDEQRQEFKSLLTCFSEKEVEISIKEIAVYDNDIEEAHKYLDEFRDMMNRQPLEYTLQEISILRANLANAATPLNDWLAKVKSETERLEGAKDILVRRSKISLIEAGEKAQIASTRAQATEEYEKAFKLYQESYATKETIEAVLSSLNSVQNAISGLQKNGLLNFNPNR